MKSILDFVCGFLAVMWFCCMPGLHANNASQLNFQKTLLIINYNHPHYGSIPFLREMYSQIFPNIVFYGEAPHPDVIVNPHNSGWWGQNVMADAMKRWPNYEGYICVQDDCWMNFWNFARLDKKKVWFTDPWKMPVSTIRSNWHWWNINAGRNAVIGALKKMPKANLKMLKHNMGAGNVGYMWSDFVYVPARLRKPFVQICQLFANPPTFVELAIPNILLSIEPKENWEMLNMNWGLTSFQQYNTSYDWVHPIKFSSADNQNFIRSVMNEWLTH